MLEICLPIFDKLSISLFILCPYFHLMSSFVVCNALRLHFASNSSQFQRIHRSQSCLCKVAGPVSCCLVSSCCVEEERIINKHLLPIPMLSNKSIQKQSRLNLKEIQFCHQVCKTALRITLKTTSKLLCVHKFSWFLCLCSADIETVMRNNNTIYAVPEIRD